MQVGLIGGDEPESLIGEPGTCICIIPAQGRLPVHISHSSTPKAYTSTLLLRRPVVSSSGGMCVTVPKVPVLIASCDSTLLSPKSATCRTGPWER